MHKYFSLFLLLAVAAFIAGGMFALAGDLFDSTGQRYGDAATAAFLGAFFAFLFVRVGDFLKSYSDRISKGHSALVQLEHLLNSNLGVIDDNIYKIQDFLEIYARYDRSSEPHAFVWANVLTEIPLLDALITQPTNIDLINELFSLNTSFRKLNDSMNATNNGYAETKGAVISRNMDLENYRLNLARLRERLAELKRFLEHELNHTVRVYSAVRVLAKKRTVLGYLIHTLPGRYYPRNFEGLCEAEEKKLRAEMKEIQETSKRELENVLRPVNIRSNT